MNNMLIQQMTSFIQELPTMQMNKALEVACGEGMVTRDILLDRFFEIDMMDRAEGAIEHANALKRQNPKIREVYNSTMQKFETDKKYNCIVLRYCTGYLSDEELSNFLKKLGSMLEKGSDDLHDQEQETSFIIIQDTALTNGTYK